MPNLRSLRRRLDRLLQAREHLHKPRIDIATLSGTDLEIRMQEIFHHAAMRGVTGTIEELAARSAIGEHYDVNELSDGDRACRVAALLVRAKQRKGAAEAARSTSQS